MAPECGIRGRRMWTRNKPPGRCGNPPGPLASATPAVAPERSSRRMPARRRRVITADAPATPSWCARPANMLRMLRPGSGSPSGPAIALGISRCREAPTATRRWSGFVPEVAIGGRPEGRHRTAPGGGRPHGIDRVPGRVTCSGESRESAELQLGPATEGRGNRQRPRAAEGVVHRGPTARCAACARCLPHGTTNERVILDGPPARLVALRQRAPRRSHASVSASARARRRTAVAVRARGNAAGRPAHR